VKKSATFQSLAVKRREKLHSSCPASELFLILDRFCVETMQRNILQKLKLPK
jgi:hypothetical protein